MTNGYAALFTAGLIGCSLSALAQGDNTSFLWRFEEANKLMEEKLFNQSAEIWDQLVKDQPTNANLNYKAGYCFFHSYNQKQKALPYLSKASEQRSAGYGGFNTAGYDPFDPKETNAPAEVDYYLGRAYHLNGDFDKADQYYQKFLAEADKNHDLAPAATRGIQQTTNARALIAAPKPYQVSNVGQVVNNDHPDFSPVLSVDGNALFFTSRRIRPDSSNSGIIDIVAGLPYENIYVTYKDREGNWQAPELININPVEAGHLASVNVSADGQTLFIYRDDGGDGNLYESRLVGELWSDPLLIGSDVNTKSWETHAAITADGNTLYFVSDRSGGAGGRDIYRVVKLPNGEWSKAQSIGAPVNTAYDEDAVFIHPNARTMFFASKGHNSMGGFDIFTTELQEDGTWSAPQNMGYPLNTVDDDAFFVTTADGRRGYFSSDQIGGYGEKDIYFVDLPEDMEAEGLTVLKGFIIPPPGTTLPPSTILYVTDKSTGEVKAYKPRQRDGVYVVILPPCKEYNLDYRVDDKTIHTEDIYVECETAYQEINKEIYLNPVSITGPASIVDLPKGSPPGAKEKGEPTKKEDYLTDAQLKEKGKTHVMPDASYADEYAKYYAYNMKDIDQAEKDWKDFIDTVVGLIEKNGKANVVIEASASNVPTKTFGTNENLSSKRMEDARARLIEAVKERGKNPDLILLEAVNSLVQGPAYRGDFINTEKYGKFQYVKLKTR
ncbi:MAG: PD40 domain-containing protein [Flavobacteriales bacterium]|nr:PD40 domain-containing protein [Flavobacteriales bacterium]